MGESIAEGTVSKWLKSVGQAVERDEPILEISTDKVDAEIPAPASGTLVAIEVEEGQTVEVGTIVAYIDTEAALSTNGGGPTKAAPAPSASAPAAAAPAPSAPAAAAPAAPAPTPAPTAAPQLATATTPPPPTAAPGEGDEPVASAEAEDRRARSTPVVRKIAEEHGVDLARVEGTGHAGRVTKQDILAYIESGQPAAATAPAAKPAASAPAAAVPRPSATPERDKPAAAPAPAVAPSELWKTFYGQVQHPEFPVREGDRVEPMDKIRRLTAEHMVVAKRIAPHVHSFIEVDFTSIDRVRRDAKKRWEEQNARVSYTGFVAWAVSRALREFPQLNGTISGNNIIYRGGVNVGIAVDLDPGLIVPVIRDTDHMSLVGIGIKIADLAERARSRQLAPDEIQGATFTITNPGVIGTLVGMPVIPKGTAAILGTGAIEKRVVVVEDPVTGADAIAIRKRALFSLGYDHRLVDGADAARFLARLKQLLEDFPADA
jgi:2-oxoglutarate dehydrogenase E2 component (dihydrolipoamide succinyltransferase)